MSRQPLPADTILGKDSDQYKIDTVLGPGGFGVTYLARSLRLDREVAIKEYFPAEFAYRDGSTTIRSHNSGSQDFFNQNKRSFIEEARVLGKFRHEHIVRVIGLLEENNTAYMILEFEEGQSFKNWLRELGRLPNQAEIDAILKPMLEALEYVHNKGIFHRDIAPDNIIIRPNGKPVLIDFGAARQFARENSHTLGAIVKHGYSPPEQYTVDTKLQGAWSDIYSLSATMYHAIMGRPPEEASKRHLQDSMLPVEEHMDAFNRTLYHPSFLAGLNAGLILRPKDRPATIGQLREILHRGRELDFAPAEQSRPNGRPARGATTAADGSTGQTHGTVVQSGPATGNNLGRRASDNRTADPAYLVGPHSDPAPGTSTYPEGSARTVAFGAVAVAALAAVGFLMLGGSYHPNVLLPVLALCGGLCSAALERGIALFQPRITNLAATAVTSATVSALLLAVFWLPFSIYPVSAIMALLAGAYAWFGYGRWVPVSLLLVAVPHLALAVWMLTARFEFASRADGALPNPYFWPLMGLSLVVVSALAIASAIQMRRRQPPLAT